MSPKIKKNINNKNICVVFDKDDKFILRLEEYIAIIIKDLQKFYKVKDPQIKIELIYSRKEFDNKLKYKIPNWLVAVALKNNIYLFSPSVIEKVSDHKKTEIKKLLTHELCHIFNDRINRNSLTWVDEGIALFIAKQRKNKNYTENNSNYFSDYYFEKNIKLLSFAANNGYRISYWAIRKIAEKFNSEKLLELLRINPEKRGCREKLEKSIGCSKKEFTETLKKASIHYKIVSTWSNFLNEEALYLPVLGPVYISGNPVQKLLSDILNNSQADNFLPYDKNKRWHKNKTERILLEEIICDDKELYVPVEDIFRNTLKVFYYSSSSPDNVAITKARKFYAKIKSAYKLNELFFYCFKEPKIKTKFTCQNIYLKNITAKDNYFKFSEEIDYYENLRNEIQLTFSDLKKEPELENFGSLWRNFIAKNKKLNPIICAVLKNKIIGAIGPLDLSEDIWNIPFLFPPHFGVAEKMRKTGLGEKLWRAAMNFAYQKGAQYTLVQNTPNSPAAHFYEKQGLSKTSKIYYYRLS